MSAGIRALVPELQPFAEALVREAAGAGLQPIVTSTFRSFAEQKALYEKFLKGQSVYPASPPGEGSHEYGWAFDLVINDMQYLPDLGDLWESWGGRWGGNWAHPDVIHFELMGASEEARRLAAVSRASRYQFNAFDFLDERFALGHSKLWDWAQSRYPRGVSSP